MDRCHTNQCLKSHEITSHLNQLPLLSDCMTFSKPLLCRQMKLTSSTQLSIRVLQNEEDLRFVTKRKFFYSINTPKKSRAAVHRLKKRGFDCGRSCLVPVPRPHYSARAFRVSCHVVRASIFSGMSLNAFTEKA